LLPIHIDNDGGRTSVVIVECTVEQNHQAPSTGTSGGRPRLSGTRLAGLNEDCA